MRLAAPGDMPGVDLLLEFLAPLQQGTVFRREVVDDVREAFPEVLRLHPGARQGARLDVEGDLGGDAQPEFFDATLHQRPPYAIVCHCLQNG